MQTSAAPAVVVVVVVVVLVWASAAAATNYKMVVGKPNCETGCGNVSVPYPFGMGPSRCYHSAGFNLTCDRSRHPPRLLLGDGGGTLFEVVDISLENTTLRAITHEHAYAAVNTTTSISSGDGQPPAVRWGLGEYEDGPYSLAPWDKVNEFILTGCNVQATVTGNRTTVVSGCSSSCFGSIFVGDNGTVCTGNGCCQAAIAFGLPSYDVRVSLLDDDHRQHLAVPVYALIAEKGWFDKKLADHLLHLAGDEEPPELAVPVILNWACPYLDAARNVFVNSTQSYCVDELGDGYYNCWCNEGYEGNPYLTAGCQDVNECERPQDYECFGDCSNTRGSFECRCPPGFHGNHTLPNGCVKPVNTGHSGLIIGLSVASGPCLLLLVLGAITIIRKLKQRRAIRLKQKFFAQNRGQLLQQLVSHRSDIAERMIIPLEELEKATNNFDQTRKLGGGGHGTVYKGILSDLHVVAIKKSNIVVQREINEFINEVAVLSQINHRNIVKLLGCCLETEVPLLVYEFISNGTLGDHLHREALRSIPWEDRLRIATEIGKALAYLHSSVSIPVIHRDIKSSNILLDDALTAKVSDFGASRYAPIDQTGITTAVQGTIGYLDPMYYYTGRLTEKSDVYSFGVILVELLTRKLPITYRSSRGDTLVVQFVRLIEEGNLVDMLDSQVVEEGGTEVEHVAAIAASCLKLRGEERPTMRQVEMALETIQAYNESVVDDLAIERTDVNYIAISYPSNTRSASLEEVSRQYSLEEEFLSSARYPR